MGLKGPSFNLDNDLYYYDDESLGLASDSDDDIPLRAKVREALLTRQYSSTHDSRILNIRRG